MIKLKVNKSICELDAEGNPERITAEIVMAHVCLTNLLIKQANIKQTKESFAATSMTIAQQASLSYKQTIDAIERMQGGDTE